MAVKSKQTIQGEKMSNKKLQWYFLLTSFFSTSYVQAFDASALNKLIRKNNLNWIAEFRSAAEIKNYGMGLADEIEPFSYPLFESNDSFLLPESIDWRDIGGTNWVSPVRNQGPCGACVPFSVTALFETYLNIANRTPNLNLNLSEQDLLARVGNCKDGANFSTALYALERGGLPDEGCMMYKAVDIPFEKTCNDRPSRAFFANRILQVRRSQLKHALQNGPVLTSMSVYDDFFAYKSGVYKYVKGPLAGGHGVVIVGYDDRIRAFIVKNSWGPYWGDKGYVKISYDETQSGFGNSNYILKADDPRIAANFKSPAEIKTFYVKTKVEPQILHDDTSQELTAVLVSQADPKRSFPIYLNGEKNQGTVDPKGISAGTYDLILQPKMNQQDWHPFYATLKIQQIPADLTLKMIPKFKPEEPVKDRIAFDIHTETAQPETLFEKIWLVFLDKDGKEKANVTETPDAVFTFGWRTQQVEDGEYTVFVRGQIGDKTIESARLKIKVENLQKNN